MNATLVTRSAAFAAIGGVLLASSTAHAHGGAASLQTLLRNWPLSLDVAVPLVVAALLYVRGVKQMRDKSEAARGGRHFVFYAGLAAIFLALLTPLDVVAEHVFAAHQVQHLLLRGIAPMLLMLAVPSAPLIAGMPAVLRRQILAPVMAHRVVRAVFRLLARPLVCTALYAGTLYVWQVPEIHNAALLGRGWHDLMHLTMLGTGMLFFWTVFDPRPAPWGAAFPHRLAMLGAAMFANIPLGAVITLKNTVAYAAYDLRGRWWGIEPLTDELLGGIVLWILASMMGLLAVLLLLRLWGRSESRAEQRRTQGFAMPSGGPADAAGDGPTAVAARRRFGCGLALIPLAVFIGVMALALWLSRGVDASLRQVAPAASPTALSAVRARPLNVIGSRVTEVVPRDGGAPKRSTQPFGESRP